MTNYPGKLEDIFNGVADPNVSSKSLHGPSGMVIPQVQADPVVVKTSNFSERMLEQVDVVATQMEHRANLLEEKAKELRTRAQHIRNYVQTLTKDNIDFAEMVVEYHNDAQSLQFVGPKDSLESGNWKGE